MLPCAALRSAHSGCLEIKLQGVPKQRHGHLGSASTPPEPRPSLFYCSLMRSPAPSPSLIQAASSEKESKRLSAELNRLKAQLADALVRMAWAVPQLAHALVRSKGNNCLEQGGSPGVCAL